MRGSAWHCRALPGTAERARQCQATEARTQHAVHLHPMALEELPHFVTAPAIIARTDCIMTIARRVAVEMARSYDLRTFPPPLRLPGFEVAMAWHPRAETDAGVTWIREQVRKTQSRKL